MQIKPIPFRRGATLRQFKGHLVGAIGSFSEACIGKEVLKKPLEVLLVQGDSENGFYARVGDEAHQVYEGPLTKAKVSFTLEAFQTDQAGDPLLYLRKDSATVKLKTCGDLREFVTDEVARRKIKGALLYAKGQASVVHIFGHTNPDELSEQTKTFEHVTRPVQIEGWGNFSFIDGQISFLHLHGTYEWSGIRKGGHFIMDDQTRLVMEKGELLIVPTSPIVRSVQQEDFPTWR